MSNQSEEMTMDKKRKKELMKKHQSLVMLINRHAANPDRPLPDSIKRQWNELADDMSSFMIIPKYHVCSDSGHVFVPTPNGHKWNSGDCVHCGISQFFAKKEGIAKRFIDQKETVRILDRLYGGVV